MIDLPTLLPTTFRSRIAIIARGRRLLRCRGLVAIGTIITASVFPLNVAVLGHDAGRRAIGSLWRVSLCIRHEG